MFSGIIRVVGIVDDVTNDAHRLVIRCSSLRDARLGDSIAINGCCLTVVAIDDDALTFDVMGETLQRTTLKTLRAGVSVNLETAVRIGDTLDGHMVAGHVDAVGVISEIDRDDARCDVTITAPAATRHIVEKGSVAVDGMSLTVTNVTDEAFSVSLIPFTLENTIASGWRVGGEVNVETDVVGKYVAKLIAPYAGGVDQKEGAHAQSH